MNDNRRLDYVYIETIHIIKPVKRLPKIPSDSSGNVRRFTESDVVAVVVRFDLILPHSQTVIL